MSIIIMKRMTYLLFVDIIVTGNRPCHSSDECMLGIGHCPIHFFRQTRLFDLQAEWI